MNPTTITAQPGTPYIDVVREFDAPPELVFRAHTDPELVARWLGPRGMQMEVLEHDARTGGSYRYVHRGREGEFRFRGVFHTVVPAGNQNAAPGETSENVNRPSSRPSLR